MLLQGKRLLVTGVLTDKSIAYAAARLAQEQGAEIVLTGFGRGLRVTERVAEKLPRPCDVLEMDVTRPEHIEAVVADLDTRWGMVDGILHAVAFAPKSALGGGFMSASWDDVSTALHISTYSFVALGRAFGPLLAKAGGGSIVGLHFDASQVWSGYDWMGVAKSGLESSCRYLAHAMGGQRTRVNLVAAGPLRTVAASGIGSSFGDFEAVWPTLAPLGWDAADATPVGRTICALWSDWLPQVTGEVIHVDGGAHAVALGTPADAPG